jgi:hypothetical protein
MKRLTVRLKPEARGAHVHVDVFVGPGGEHLALSGRLVFTEAEWKVLLPFAQEVETLVNVHVPEERLVSLEVRP